MEQKFKNIVSTDVSVVDNNNNEHGPSSSRMGGRYLEILLSLFVMTVPMLAFSALLLGLIYYYHIVRNPFPSDKICALTEDKMVPVPFTSDSVLLP
jgi:Na+/serine symporter